ncbi:hypothetical protein [Stenotrophomonas sp. Marseille-Q5258]|uniref:hypothetical protein n=1 Tax=Stenotrophomonas sp. Marseille-Q5258 TaxID=2972779 RepID=UPI0021C8F4BC|nr:hypothetical protein [Stenotrophomonas sp. Marseille-Q5258]
MLPVTSWHLAWLVVLPAMAAATPARVPLACAGDFARAWADTAAQLTDGEQATTLVDALLCRPDSEGAQDYLRAHGAGAAPAGPDAPARPANAVPLPTLQAAHAEAIAAHLRPAEAPVAPETRDIHLAVRAAGCADSYQLIYTGHNDWRLAGYVSACH